MFTRALIWQRAGDDARAPLGSIRPCHFGPWTAIGSGFGLLGFLRCPSSPLFSWEPVHSHGDVMGGGSLHLPVVSAWC